MVTTRGVFLINDTGVSGHPGCVTVMSAIRDNLEMRGLPVTGHWPMGAEPHLGLSAAPALRHARAVVVNGEGTLHNTAQRPGARRLLHAMKRARLATRAPIFLINATLENLRSRDFDVLRGCSAIFLRDRASCRYAEAHGLPAIFAPDLCFGTSYARREREAGLVVTDSTLPDATAMLCRWGEGSGARYLPMQPPRLASLLYWALTPRRHERMAARYFAAISAAAMLVTGRFHAVIFALMAETPFLALGSNTSKIQSLLVDVLGATDRLVTTDQLLEGRSRVPALTGEEAERIRHYRRDARARLDSMFDRIAQSAARFGHDAAC